MHHISRLLSQLLRWQRARRRRASRRVARATAGVLDVAYLEAGDPDFPFFYQLSHATAKIGADNPDNIYWNASIRGTNDYRITGRRGSMFYFSIVANAMRYHIDANEMIDRSRTATMRRGAKPSAVLNLGEMEGAQQLPPEELDRIHAEYDNEFGGVDNHGKLIVTPPGVKP